MKPIVSRFSHLILRSKPSPIGRWLASRRMAACTAVARGHPSQGDAKHRPETHRLRDAPQDEVRRGGRYDSYLGNAGLDGLVIPGRCDASNPESGSANTTSGFRISSLCELSGMTTWNE